MAAEKKPFQRLPTDVLPTNYKLRLHPDLQKFTFQGTSAISVQVKNPTASVKLNCIDIEVKDVKYKGGKSQDFTEGIKIDYSKEDETVSFTFPRKLQAGIGTLNLAFTGKLNDNMKGFYRSKYTTPGGEERYSGVTQFESTDARSAFPCWDEPSIKATFDITLVAPTDYVTLSNMPAIRETPLEGNPNLKVVEFEKTPVMSTYLVAFVIGEYDHIEAKDSDGVLVRVYTPVGKKVQGEFALQVAVKILPFYKKYFQIAYPLPKIDMIALADFASGAMENWGLITYRERALLVDPENSSSTTKQYVALYVGHELAHQWFGNLVTMEWWTHLWLKEGFASWIEYLCVDYCFPEYDIWTQFASSTFSTALELDALNNSHPVEIPVGHPSEVDEVYDDISYEKGAAIIRMLHDYIGDEDYRKGMNIYLTKHSYKNTVTEDLWATLQEASGKPVREIMSTWTKQMGFPILRVFEETKGNFRTLTITQEKFCADGKSEGNTSSWHVPVSISSASSPAKAIHQFVLDKKEAEVTLEVKPDDWLKLNTGGVGFYRTQYSQEMLDKLLPGVRQASLPPRDRLALQNDVFALARAGVSSSVDFLKLIVAYETETNFTVWSDISTNLNSLAILVQNTDYYSKFQGYVRKLFSKIYQKLGWDAKPNESHLDSVLRNLVIKKLGKNGDEAVVAEARKRFTAHCDGSATIPADLRGAVYQTVMTHGMEKEYEQMMKLIKATDLHEEHNRIMRSLGAVQDEKLKRRVLDFAISDDVRSQDTVFVIAGVTESVKGRDLAWKFVMDNWKMLHSRYEGGFLMSTLVKATIEDFITEGKAKEIEAFFKANPAPVAERAIQQALENIHLNKEQLARDSAAIKEFLQSY